MRQAVAARLQFAIGHGLAGSGHDEGGLQRTQVNMLSGVHRLFLFYLSMISAQTRSAFVARENRYPPCTNAALRVRIMLYAASNRISRNCAGLSIWRGLRGTHGVCIACSAI